MATTHMRRLTADEVRLNVDQLLELQHRAYALEAELIGDDRIPPLHETATDLISSGLEWIATFDEQQIIGAVGYSVDHGVLDLDRLMISPMHRRKGLGAALVTEVISLASQTIVSTGRENTPARALYESLGFTHESDFEPIPGLWVSQYSRSSSVR